jgi:hypothetical protein
MMDQGRALLDEGSMPPALSEDGPASTIVTALTADEDDGTYKTLSK